MASNHNDHECLVRVRGRWREDIGDTFVGGNMDEHICDSATVTVGLVTNTPGDLIGLGSITISMMGDGFYMVSRSTIGGGSQLIASGKVDAPEGTQQFSSEYAELHRVVTAPSCRSCGMPLGITHTDCV